MQACELPLESLGPFAISESVVIEDVKDIGFGLIGDTNRADTNALRRQGDYFFLPLRDLDGADLG